MPKLPRNTLLLLKLDLLSGVRKGVLAKLLGGRLFSTKTALTLKVAAALVWIGVACVIPLFTLSDFGETTEIGRSLVRYHHLIINGSAILMFYVGLFIGASLIFELSIGENEQLLSFPIVVEDLVHFRVMDVHMAILSFCVYIIYPFTCLMYLALGWSAAWTVAMMILTAVSLFAVCLLGINVLLSIAKRLPRRGSDGICITIFLVSGWLFVIAVRLYKDGFFGPATMPIWQWLDLQMSVVSFSSMMDSMVSRNWGIGQYVLSLAAGGMLVLFLSKVCVRTFGQAFERIHRQADDMTARVKRSAARLSFMNLSRLLRFLPLDIRTLLVKDIVALVRRPRMLVNALVFVVFLVLIANYRHTSVADPMLFVLYFSSTFIVSRFFVNIIGQERNNILVIKQLAPSVTAYLSSRVKITFGVSLAVLLPFWGVLIGFSNDLALLETVWRLPLLLLNVILASTFVTWYSATFAVFSTDSFRKHNFGIHPAAMLVFWGFGMLVSYFFYRSDLALLAHEVGEMTTVLLVVIGVFLAVSTAAFRFLGIRRIKHYA